MSLLPSGLRGRLVVASAASAVLVALPAAAFAANFSVSPSTNLIDGQNVTVTGNGYTSGPDYKLGVCSKETYGIFGIPACATGQNVSPDGSGNLSEVIQVDQVNTNAHYTAVPWPLNINQPEEFDCSVDACEILLTDHNGTSSVTVDRQDISFQ